MDEDFNETKDQFYDSTCNYMGMNNFCDGPEPTTDLDIRKLYEEKNLQSSGVEAFFCDDTVCQEEAENIRKIALEKVKERPPLTKEIILQIFREAGLDKFTTEEKHLALFGL